MTNPPIVTLITDFGLHDEYVGVMKGIILRHAPEARIVDITHLIPPHATTTAAHILSRSYRYFPAQSVHLVVVDPGVGSDRSILAVTADGQYFVGPDNGIFTSLFDCSFGLAIHRINTSPHRQNSISSTFHGRDIMAPIAGQLAMGFDIASLGPKILPEQCQRLTQPVCHRLAHTLLGEIVHIDTFGNLCTNICKRDMEDFAPYQAISIEIGKNRIVPLETTYTSRGKGMALALFDSYDYLEIAVCQGKAAEVLGMTIGDKVIVSYR